MQTLYLIRHTRPDIPAGTCYGQLDIGLVDDFAAHAHDIADLLPPPDLIITSPLQRTRQLAEHLAAAHRCELRRDARLIEKNFGAWEGKAWDDIPRDEIDAWATDLLGYAPPGGESAQQLLQRVEEVLEDITLLPQQEIAIVAHGGSIRAMLALIAEEPLVSTLVWGIEYGAVIAVRI